jgi:hypothetical protein
LERTSFILAYFELVQRAYHLLKQSHREGLLSLEESRDYKLCYKRDIFELGLHFSIDGTDWDYIDKILSNLIEQDKDDHYYHLLGVIKKEAVRCIYYNDKPRMFLIILNSYVSIEDDPVTEYLYKTDDNGCWDPDDAPFEASLTNAIKHIHTFSTWPISHRM